ncbi:MAG: hypothetical protein Q4G63_10005 [Bacteroidia bacterium]|nr:hypothetical protein [Bacteroidia bacterium]
MFTKREKAVYPLIYDEVARNHRFTEGKTFGEISDEIDTIYRQKLDAYKLSDKGYFTDDEIATKRDEKEVTDFFNRKAEQGKL